jgi:predicted Zn-dependent peptidase
MLEHMAFKGTRSRTALQIAEAIENVGGDLNAATSVEHTGYFARVLKEDVALAGDILSDILQNSVFEQAELDREQQVIVQEIGAARDNPDDHVFDLFQQAAYPEQAIGRTILGTVESVNSFNPDAIRAYMDRTYVGEHMVLCAAGNVDHDALVDIATNRFTGLRAGGAPRPEKAAYIGGEQRLVSEHEGAHTIQTASTLCRSSPRSSAAACRAGCFRKCARSAASATRSTPFTGPSRTAAFSASRPPLGRRR